MYVYRITNTLREVPYAGKQFWTFHRIEDGQTEPSYGYVRLGKNRFAKGLRAYRPHELVFVEENYHNLQTVSKTPLP